MKKKTAYHHGRLEEALLAAGIHEARLSGERNLGVTHLARTVDVSPMAIYRHFPNGESLKAAISREARQELARRMTKAMAVTSDVKTRFIAMGRAYIEFGLSEPGLFSVAFMRCDAPITQEDQPSSWFILHNAIVELCEAGLIDRSEVDSVALLAWSTVHGYSVLASGSDRMRPDTRPEAIDELLERVWTGIVEHSSVQSRNQSSNPA